MHDLDLEKIIKIMDNMTNDCCCCCDVLRIRYKKNREKIMVCGCRRRKNETMEKKEARVHPKKKN